MTHLKVPAEQVAATPAGGRALTGRPSKSTSRSAKPRVPPRKTNQEPLAPWSSVRRDASDAIGCIVTTLEYVQVVSEMDVAFTG